MISPGEIAVGQWIIIHGPTTKEKSFNGVIEGNPVATLIRDLDAAIDPTHPHIVLAVQLPFIVVADCTDIRPTNKIWRTDEKNFVEVSPEFVVAWNATAFVQGTSMARNSLKKPVDTKG